jgi:hypothetical protein
MKGWRQLVYGIVVLTAVCLWASPLQAQQDEGQKPKPAAKEYPPLLEPGDKQQDADEEPQKMQPDNGPLGGIQNPTLGTTEMRHSYWVPGIEYSNAARSNSVNAASKTGWDTTSYLSANASLLAAWSHSVLSANFSGGGFFSTDGAQGNGQYHQLAAAYEIEERRWQLLFVDQFSYLPQTAFGFGGTTGLAFPGITGNLAVPLPGLQNVFLPNQSILTTNGPRYSNASAVQLTYAVGSRGSITLAGVYGILRFTEPGNVDNESEILNAGYNYALTRKDTLGLIYRFGAYHYPGDPQAFGDHVAQVAYGRKITGRLGLQLAGGPEITTFRVAIGGSARKISGSGNAVLTYAFSRSGVALNYTHGVSGGAGIFSGSEIDIVNAIWNRQLTRVWNGSINFGYAKNRQIVSFGGPTAPVYDTWLAGAGLSRPLGREANFSLGYQAQIQNSNIAICAGPGCGTNYTVHEIFGSFQWHARPLVLR